MSTSTTQPYETFIRATPEEVWAALTRPEHTERYFFGTRVALDVERRTIRYAMADGALMVDGEVLALSAPRELTTTWRVHYDPGAAGEVSRVTWRVEPRGKATKLTVIHALEGAPVTAKNVGADGWSVVLSGLKTLLETGSPLELAPPA